MDIAKILELARTAVETLNTVREAIAQSKNDWSESDIEQAKATLAEAEEHRRQASDELQEAIRAKQGRVD